jgi:hypothetical protein
VSPRWPWRGDERRPDRAPDGLDAAVRGLIQVTADLRDEVARLRAIREDQERGGCAGPEPE